MRISGLLNKWKKLISLANDKGIPFPMVRDPNTLEGSVSLTLVVLSSFIVMVGIVGRWSKWLDGIDMNNAMQFFYASSTLYFGHTWVNKPPDDSSNKSTPPAAPVPPNLKVDNPDQK